MKKSAMLLQERAQKIEAQKALHTVAATEKRSLNETETATFRALQTEIEALSGQITDALAYEENLRSLEGSQSIGFVPEGGEAPKAKRTFSLNKAIRALISGTPLDGVELEASQRARRAAELSGVGLSPSSLAVPLFSETRADGQTVTADAGAYLRFTNAATITVSTATDFPIGQQVQIFNDGTALAITTNGATIAGGGTSITSGTLTVGSRYGAISIFCVDTDNYRIIGNVS